MVSTGCTVEKDRIIFFTLNSRRCVRDCVGAMLRMEDKIRRLCTQLLAAKDDEEEFRSILVELRNALHQNIERLRARFAAYPFIVERRVPNSTLATSGLPWLAEGRDFQMTCHICNRPLRLAIDTAADEEGKAVHETCYVQVVLKSNSPQTSAAD